MAKTGLQKHIAKLQRKKVEFCLLLFLLNILEFDKDNFLFIYCISYFSAWKFISRRFCRGWLKTKYDFKNLLLILFLRTNLKDFSKNQTICGCWQFYVLCSLLQMVLGQTMGNKLSGITISFNSNEHPKCSLEAYEENSVKDVRFTPFSTGSAAGYKFKVGNVIIVKYN